MTTIVAIFLISFVVSLTLTPIVRDTALKKGWVDSPCQRKIHTVCIPRIGGVVIFFAFFLPFLGSLFYSTLVLEMLDMNRRIISLLIGSALIFGMGLFDDICNLKAGTKLLVQILVALIVYYGGIRIQAVTVPGAGHWTLGALSLPATIFWFLLIINAVNLVDGLDGLAAGVTFFASLILLFLCVADNRLFIAMGFSALCGSTLGFLRYNFNPASIFMGDSGSYFLGYMYAALGILGSVKSQATVAVLIPVIALGVPLMDTILSPIRRFIKGDRLFQPDKDHLHHRLMKLGLTHRGAVLTLYAFSVILGVVALVLVNVKDDRAAMILGVIAVAFFFGIRKLGYLEYVASDKIYGWFRDIRDEMGLTRERRSFLNLQIEINQSRSLGDLWNRICTALDKLDFDMAEMELLRSGNGGGKHKKGFHWTKNGFNRHARIYESSLFKLEMPLIGEQKEIYGTLWMIKDLKRNAISHYTLRRVEHLRRTVITTLSKLN